MLTWKLEGEVKSCQHDGEEDPPSTKACHKAEGTSCDLKMAGHYELALSAGHVGTSQATKSADEGEENHEEHDVGSER